MEINSYNAGASTITATLLETGALGVSGGHQEFNPGDSDKGDCANLDAIQIASSNWNGGTVAYALTIAQIG